MINSCFQFVEITFKGCKLGQHRFSLDASDLDVNPSEAGDNLSGAWKVIGTSLDSQTKLLETELKQIREAHLIPLTGFPPIILGEHRSAFDKAMEAFQKKVRDGRERLKESIEAELTSSRSRIKKILTDNYMKNPPEQIRRRCLSDSLLAKQIEGRVEVLLDCKYPKASSLLSKMDVDWTIFNISEQIITKPNFVQAGKKVFGVDVEDMVTTEQAVALKPLVDDGALCHPD